MLHIYHAWRWKKVVWSHVPLENKERCRFTGMWVWCWLVYICFPLLLWLYLDHLKDFSFRVRDLYIVLLNCCTGIELFTWVRFQSNQSLHHHMWVHEVRNLRNFKFLHAVARNLWDTLFFILSFYESWRKIKQKLRNDPGPFTEVLLKQDPKPVLCCQLSCELSCNSEM